MLHIFDPFGPHKHKGESLWMSKKRKKKEIRMQNVRRLFSETRFHHQNRHLQIREGK
jgi:hypothetical protein